MLCLVKVSNIEVILRLNLNVMSRHIRSKHSEIGFKCSQCDKIFGRQDALSRHIKSEHVEKEYSCDECDLTFYREDTLNRHIESVHCGKIHKCLECKKFHKSNHDMNQNKHINKIYIFLNQHITLPHIDFLKLRIYKQDLEV